MSTRYLVRERAFRDEFGHKYDHVVLCAKTTQPLLAMHAKEVHGVYLMSEMIDVLSEGGSNMDLTHADHMIVPIHEATSAEEYDWFENTIFCMSDFALFLIRLRDRSVPHWNAYTFADHFLTRHRFRWTNARVFELGGHLQEDQALPTTGLVRSALIHESCKEHDFVTEYTDVRTGARTTSFSMFDRRQIHFQVVFDDGDALQLHETTPEEYRKPAMLCVTRDKWRVIRTPSRRIAADAHQRKGFLAEIIVTMVIVSDEDVAETRVRHVRYVTAVRANHVVLNEPVVGVFRPDDSVFFECEIPLLGIQIRYLGYRVVPLGWYKEDMFACEIRNIICPNHATHENEDILRVMRFSFAVKRIQRRWRECVSDPAFVVCQHRLLREWNELI